jgi:hypothetical protein
MPPTRCIALRRRTAAPHSHPRPQDYDFDYESDDAEADDADVENTYYNAKAKKRDEPEAALAEWRRLVDAENPKGDWCAPRRGICAAQH